MDEMKSVLEKLAKRKCWDDDDEFNPMDQSGSNFDDAYSTGQMDGKTRLAQTLLLKFFS